MNLAYLGIDRIQTEFFVCKMLTRVSIHLQPYSHVDMCLTSDFQSFMNASPRVRESKGVTYTKKTQANQNTNKTNLTINHKEG